MTCDDEALQVDTRWEAVEAADLEVAKARQRVENRLKGSLAACGIAAIAGLGGKVGAVLGFGAACIAALLSAEDAAADYEYAVGVSQLAHKYHAQAVLKELMCIAHCELQDT
jgi:hypothetical protein